MGYLSKKEYEYKAAWAKKRMEENAQVETLTEVQHELLRELCQFRHKLHCNWKSAFNEEAGNYSYYAREIAEWYDYEGLCEKIEKEFGKKPFIRRNYYTMHEIEEQLELMSEAYADFEAINTEIEIFLNEIDMVHGTKYCPSGMTRLY